MTVRASSFLLFRSKGRKSNGTAESNRKGERERETPTFDKSGLTSRAPSPPYPFSFLSRYSLRVDLGNAISRFWITPRFFRSHRVPPKRVSLLIDNVVLDRKRVDANASRFDRVVEASSSSSSTYRIVRMDSTDGRCRRRNE